MLNYDVYVIKHEHGCAATVRKNQIRQLLNDTLREQMSGALRPNSKQPCIQ